MLSYLSGGIEIPNFLVQYEFNMENQNKKIEFINLKKFYDKPISEKKITEIYEKNKSFYTETLKDFSLNCIFILIIYLYFKVITILKFAYLTCPIRYLKLRVPYRMRTFI